MRLPGGYVAAVEPARPRRAGPPLRRRPGRPHLARQRPAPRRAGRDAGALSRHAAAAGLLPSPAHDRARNIVASPAGRPWRSSADVRPLVDGPRPRRCCADPALAAPAGTVPVLGRRRRRPRRPRRPATWACAPRRRGRPGRRRPGRPASAPAAGAAAALALAAARAFLDQRGPARRSARVAGLPDGGAAVGRRRRRAAWASRSPTSPPGCPSAPLPGAAAIVGRGPAGAAGRGPPRAARRAAARRGRSRGWRRPAGSWCRWPGRPRPPSPAWPRPACWRPTTTRWPGSPPAAGGLLRGRWPTCAPTGRAAGRRGPGALGRLRAPLRPARPTPCRWSRPPPTGSSSATTRRPAGRASLGATGDGRVDYERDGAAIYRASFATIRRRGRPGPRPARRRPGRRPHDPRLRHGRPGRRPGLVARRRRRGAARPCARARRCCATRRWSPPGSPAAGCPAGNEVVCTLADPRVPALAAELGTTRSAAALELWRDRLDGAWSPSATRPRRCSGCWSWSAGGAAPGRRRWSACRWGSSAPPSPRRPWPRARGACYLVVHGRRGGSALAAAAVNAMASEPRMSARRRLSGVGLGPGDPELVTVKAARLIGEADVVAYHSARHGAQHRPRRGRAVPPRRPGRGGPASTRSPPSATDHPGGYAGRARRLLRRGRAAGWPPTWTPAATWWCCARATRSSTAPTCTCTSGWRAASPPRSCPA